MSERVAYRHRERTPRLGEARQRDITDVAAAHIGGFPIRLVEQIAQADVERESGSGIGPRTVQVEQAFRGQPMPDELSAEAKISKVDDNRDGVLSAAEHEAASRAKFAEMDHNNDGALSQAEFDLGHQVLKHG